MSPRPPEVTWHQYDRCLICEAAAGVPCRNLLAGGVPTRAHPSRLLLVERSSGGEMLMARGSRVRWSRSGNPIASGPHVHHCVTAGTGATVCGASIVDGESWTPLAELENRQRCQSLPCKRLWREEEYR